MAITPAEVSGTVQRIWMETTKNGASIGNVLIMAGRKWDGSDWLVHVKAFGQNNVIIGNWLAGDEVKVTAEPGSREYNGRVYTDMVLRSVLSHSEVKRPDAKPTDGGKSDDPVSF